MPWVDEIDRGITVFNDKMFAPMGQSQLARSEAAPILLPGYR
jgi:hypothetical protein